MFLQLENREGYDRNAESRMYLDGESLVKARRMHCEGLMVEFPRKVMAFIINLQYLDCLKPFVFVIYLKLL